MAVSGGTAETTFLWSVYRSFAKDVLEMVSGIMAREQMTYRQSIVSWTTRKILVSREALRELSQERSFWILC
jgi:hypothetical protein